MQITSALFLDVTQRRLVVGTVPKFRDKISDPFLKVKLEPLNMGPTGSPETSELTSNLRWARYKNSQMFVFYFCEKKTFYLNTKLYVTFAGYNLQASRQRHICNR